MLPVQKIIRLAPSVSRNVIQSRGVTRSSNVVSLPATVKISFAEKVVHGVVIAACISFIPAWVLTHVRDYQDRKQ